MTVLFGRAVTAGAALAALGLGCGLAGLAAGQTANPEPAAHVGSASSTESESVSDAGTSGRVIAKGPGYSIVATSPGARASAGDTRVTDAPLEMLHEPIVCQGQRVLHIDNRDIRFDGNAISAEDGCEVHITNSRISASGIAVHARNASIHIENSEIEGQKSSIDAVGGAQIYAQESTFKGAARRLGRAAIHDLGNNNWL